jgi:putative component of toxin-antitoxin plasmid stabilization module
MKENKEAIAFLKEYCLFDNPNTVWMFKGISRHKDNKDNENMDRFMRRLVVAKAEDIESCYQDVKKMANKSGTTYRLYVSLNSRDVVKGLFNFQKKMIDIGQGLARGLDDHLGMAKKVGSLWKTELEQRSNRGTKRFLIDIDEDDELLCQEVVNELRLMEDQGMTIIRAVRRTVSGYGIAIDACDTRSFLNTFKDNDVSIQKDSMLFIESWKGTE